MGDAHAKVALIIIGLLVAPLTAAGLSETGVISGRIVLPPGETPAFSLFLENQETDRIVVVPLAPGQDSYSAVVPPGTYRAYTWLLDFSRMGAYTACCQAQPCTDHTLLPVPVAAGQSVGDIDIGDWHRPASSLIVLRGRLLDGSGAEPVADGVLVIWEQHIMAVGPASELAAPALTRHFRLPGATILPGFINTHVHNAYDATNLERWASAGVTTVRDLGAPVDLSWDIRQSLFADDPRYARILAAGPLVTCPDGYPIAGNSFPSLTLRSEEQARNAIDRLIDRGADVIKLSIESGVGDVLSEELATVAADTAHARGVPVTVHLTRTRDLRTALDAGVDDVAHMVIDHVPDALIQRMVANDVGWVPTLQVLRGNGTEMLGNLQRFIAAGGRVAVGNDSGYLSGVIIGMPQHELERMELAGMTPMQIIVAATSDAAVVCHRQDLLGTLAPGKLADVLVVDGDPLTDLQALGDVRMVIHEGEIIRQKLQSPRRMRRHR